MNSQEAMNALRQLLTLVAAFAAGAGWITKDQATSIVGDVFVIVPAAVSLGSVAWSIYVHWGMKKVPENATVKVAPAVKAVVALLAASFALSFAFPAHAATTATTLSPQAVAQKIQQLAKPDVAYALQLASAVNTPQSKVRAQCYQAISDALPTPPANATLPPEPHLVTNVEELAEVIDALQPDSPLFVACGGAAQLVQQNTLAFINAVVTGFLGVTKALPLAAVIP